MQRKILWVLLILLPVLVNGSLYLASRDLTVKNVDLPTQMADSPAHLPQQSNPVLTPVSGTVPRGYHPFHYGTGEEEMARAGRELKNPFAPTEENLNRGEYVYNNYCLVCHGSTGIGDGPLIPQYPNPASYKTEKSRNLPDGALFHIITLGRGDMPSHASQVTESDRWKVILYLRKLQESK